MTALWNKLIDRLWRYCGRHRRKRLDDGLKVRIAKMNGTTLAAIEVGNKWVQANCNHLKDAGAPELHSDYAVIKHTFANGDVHVRCLRCGKKWRPGDQDYAEAIGFSTTNKASTGLTFKGPGFTERHREAVKNS